MSNVNAEAISKCNSFLTLLNDSGIISQQQFRSFRASLVQDELGPQRMMYGILSAGGVADAEVASAFAEHFGMLLYPNAYADSDLKFTDRQVLRADELTVVMEGGWVYLENPLDQRSFANAERLLSELHTAGKLKEGTEITRLRFGIISRSDRLQLIEAGHWVASAFGRRI